MILFSTKNYIQTVTKQLLYLLFFIAGFLNAKVLVFADETSAAKGDKFIEISSESMKEAGIEFASAGPGKIQETVTLLGEISLNENLVVRVRPRFAGIVKEVLKKQGENVKPGEVLAIIQSNESLSRYEVTAEIAGRIIGRNVSQGEFIKDDQEIFTIANLSTIWVNAAAYESMSPKLKAGMAVTVISDSRNIRQDSVIDFIDAFLLKQSRSQNVRVVLVNTKEEWIPGMFVSVKIITDVHDIACSVPTEAVTEIDGHSFVFVKSKNEDSERVEARQVTVGQKNSEFSEITENLAVGTSVAVKNSFLLKAQLEKGAPD